MKALLHDCPIAYKKNDSDHDNKNSFSFKETQLKQSFEKEKKLIGKQCESLREELDQKDNKILELKDTIRMQNQDYEALRHKMRELDPSAKFYTSDNGYGKSSYRGGSQNEDLDADSVRISGTLLVSKSSDQPIQPYDKSKKQRESQTNLIQLLQEENDELRAKLEYKAENEDRNSKNEQAHIRKTTPDHDGTVVIGGISNMNLNTTDEHDISMKNCKIEMSPIETRKDVSQADEAILRVFDHSGQHKSSKRRLDFEDNEMYGKENVTLSAPDLGRIRKINEYEDVYRSSEEIDQIKQELELKDNKIEELTTRLEFYTSNKNSKDYSSPRFREPEYVNNERIKNQRLTAEKVFEELSRIFAHYQNVKNIFCDKFES